MSGLGARPERVGILTVGQFRGFLIVAAASSGIAGGVGLAMGTRGWSSLLSLSALLMACAYLYAALRLRDLLGPPRSVLRGIVVSGGALLAVAAALGVASGELAGVFGAVAGIGVSAYLAFELGDGRES
jgi:hypothetical protein